MRLLKNGLLVFAADITQNVLNLVRNMLLARLLTVEQFGIAVTFSILVTLVDATNNAGLNRMIVQAPDADEPHVQNTLHLVSVLLGLCSALILAIAAYPYALAMGMPQLGWAYFLIALIPIMRGFLHLDPQRFQRQHRFGAAVVRQLLPQVISTIAIWPLFLLFHDFRVILGSIFLAQISYVAASHMGAERPFRLARDPAVIDRAIAYGAPLLLNSLLMFLLFNGDRMIVTGRFGPEVLGGFSAAFMLTLMATILVNNTVTSLMMPRMSQARDEGHLQRLYEMTGSATMLLMALLITGTAILGPFVMTLLFGAKYAPATGYLLPLAIMQAIRTTRVATDIAAMAKAQTRIPLYSNIVRVLGFPVSYLFALLTGDIYLMIATGVCAEIATCLYSALLTRQRIGLSSRHFLLSLCALTLLSAAVYGVSVAWLPWWAPVPAAALFLFSVRDLLMNYKALLHT